MEYTKEKLDNLSLVEIKHICKSHKLPFTGTKSRLIKLILDLYKPEVVTINDHKGLYNGKKIVGIKLTDKEGLVNMGKMVEKSNAKFSYYSMGVSYYFVEK